MVARLGGHAHAMDAPFDPEAGAYAGGRTAPSTLSERGSPSRAMAIRASLRRRTLACAHFGPALRSGGGFHLAPPALYLALPRLPHRRLRLQPRPRMGRRGRRRPRRAHRCAPGSRTSCATAPAAPTPSCSVTPTARAPRRRWPPSPTLRRRASPAAERRLEDAGPRHRLCLAAAVWGAPLLAAQPGHVAYPVAVGALAGAHAVPEDDAALGLLHAFAANLISAAVRLVPLGQTAGLRVLAGLAPLLARSRTTRATPPWTTSAARASGPTSRPCVTKPNTRGCSAHEH